MKITLILAFATLAVAMAFQFQSNRFSSKIKPLQMSEQLFMPALSSSSKDGKIVSWSKKIGDKISIGDVILAVQSDYAAADIESYEEGYLASVLVKEGEYASVGSPVAVIVKSLDELKNIGNSPVPTKTLSFILTFDQSKPVIRPSSSSSSSSGKALLFASTFDDDISTGKSVSSFTTFDEPKILFPTKSQAPAPVKTLSFTKTFGDSLVRPKTSAPAKELTFMDTF